MNNKGADQPVRASHSLVSVFAVRCLDSMIPIQGLCILKLGIHLLFYFIFVPSMYRIKASSFFRVHCIISGGGGCKGECSLYRVDEQA